MLKIKWIGIIDENDIEKYQKGNLDSKAIKMEMPKTMNEVMLKGLPFGIIPAVIMLLSGRIKENIYSQTLLYRKYIFIGLLIGLVLALIHELLHAIVYPKEAEKYIGIIKPFTFCQLASYPLSKKRFILMSLLPYILGIIPYIVFWVIPAKYVILNSIIRALGLFGMVSPYPDAYNVYQVLKQVPKGKKVQFYGNDTYYL